MQTSDRRLIEAGFPCHQIGAETQRERGSSSALPPLYFLHVWWARRPLTASRAAIMASLAPADMDVKQFLLDLGMSSRVAMMGDNPWTLTGDLLLQIRRDADGDHLVVDTKVANRFRKEVDRRSVVRSMISGFVKGNILIDDLGRHLSVACRSFDVQDLTVGARIPVVTIASDPASVNRRIEAAKTAMMGKRFDLDSEDLYGCDRAFKMDPTFTKDPKVVLDVTSGGGSIPFEAMRLGHHVIANELNPVATTILRATLDYPVRYGISIIDDFRRYGGRVNDFVSRATAGFFPRPELPIREIEAAKRSCGPYYDFTTYGREHDQTGFIFAREVTCPHCKGDVPLLNTHWLAKNEGSPWAVHMQPKDGNITFECYLVGDCQAPSDADPDRRTVTDGEGSCPHPTCRQAIEGDEIKRQARGESVSGRMRDRLYAVAAVRVEPQTKGGIPVVYKAGPRIGEIRTRKISFFRSPTIEDQQALDRAQECYNANFEGWDRESLIPTEAFPRGNDMRPPNHGMLRWCDLFTPRQLVGHVAMAKAILALREEMVTDLGLDRANAVMTLLQMAADKCLDYNSRQTRWHTGRGAMVGTFGRHDFSMKWTFGEMPMSGPSTAQAWSISQIVDAMTGLCGLTKKVHERYHETGTGLPTILNGSAASMPSVDDSSVDAIVFDPPYYDKVQYAELSDYFYVWQKRTLKDVHPDLFRRRMTDKTREAVANPARDDGTRNAKASYERRMGEIFLECRRVLKDEGVMTMMFTHKGQDAWETLTRSLIENGFVITASVPVESEAGDSMHQKDKATASTTVFITCRKRQHDVGTPAEWSGIGGGGVKRRIRETVVDAIAEFEHLGLSPVDEMIACYGRALQVLSERWPVMDGDDVVSPSTAMAEASSVVAGREILRMTGGIFRIDDFDVETAFALTLIGVEGFGDVRYDLAANLSKATGIALAEKSEGYNVVDGQIGLTPIRKGVKPAAPLGRNGSKVVLLLPDERDVRRLEHPQTVWDRVQGSLLAYREGDEISARAYLDKHGGADRKIGAVLRVIADGDAGYWSKAAESVSFALRHVREAA